MKKKKKRMKMERERVTGKMYEEGERESVKIKWVGNERTMGNEIRETRDSALFCSNSKSIFFPKPKIISSLHAM